MTLVLIIVGSLVVLVGVVFLTGAVLTGLGLLIHGLMKMLKG
jgi:hypothetical protein